MVLPPILTYLDHEKQSIVECNASNYIIGVLSQYSDNNQLHPIYYYSKLLKKSEINYLVTEKKLLTIKIAFDKWQHLLKRAKLQVLVYSDHKN